MEAVMEAVLLLPLDIMVHREEALPLMVALPLVVLQQERHRKAIREELVTELMALR
jgi:hypothetical protein